MTEAERRILIIDNPVAGRRGRAGPAFAATLDALAAEGAAVTVMLSERPGHAEVLARDHVAAFDVVVAAGGDGTVNEVVNGLLAAKGGGARPLLATLPYGTMNVLALETGLDGTPAATARVLARGGSVAATVGIANDRRFLLTAGAGIDSAAVRYLTPRLKRSLRGGANFAALAMALVRDGGALFEVEVDGERHAASTLITTSASRYAGPHVVAPGARLDDGTLHVLLGLGHGRWNLMRYGIAYARGRIPYLPDVLIKPTRRVRVLSPAGYPVQLDGDNRAQVPLDITLDDRTLEVLSA